MSLKKLNAALAAGNLEEAKAIAAKLESKETKKPARASKPKAKIGDDGDDQALTVLAKTKLPSIGPKKIQKGRSEVVADNKRMVRPFEALPKNPKLIKENLKAAAETRAFKNIAKRDKVKIVQVRCKSCKAKFSPMSYLDNTLDRKCCMKCQS